MNVCGGVVAGLSGQWCSFKDECIQVSIFRGGSYIIAFIIVVVVIINLIIISVGVIMIILILV